MEAPLRTRPLRRPLIYVSYITEIDFRASSDANAGECRMVTREIIGATLLFAALVLGVSLQGLEASGHFPREHRAPVMSSGFGPVLLYGSIAIAIICLGAGIVAALRLIPWYAAIIGGGLSLLSAPLVLQCFPDRFVDGRGSAVGFTCANVVLALILVGITPDGFIRF